MAIDLSKAFNRLDHGKLITMMFDMGVPICAIRLLKSYLGRVTYPRCSFAQQRDCPVDVLGHPAHVCSHTPPCATWTDSVRFPPAPAVKPRGSSLLGISLLNPHARVFIPTQAAGTCVDPVSSLNPNAPSFVPNVCVSTSVLNPLAPVFNPALLGIKPWPASDHDPSVDLVVAGSVVANVDGRFCGFPC